MQFLKNLHPFIHKTNMEVYSNYLIQNKLLASLLYTKMECMDFLIATKSFLQKYDRKRKIQVKKSML